MQTTRRFRCACNVMIALLMSPVMAMGQVPPTRVASRLARDSSHGLLQSSHALLPTYSSLPSFSYPLSSPFAGGISGGTARFTPSTALVGDSSRSSNHRTRNVILGAAIGLAAGAYIGGRVGAKAHPCGDHSCEGPPLDQLFDAMGGALFGMVAGIVVGATVSGPP